MLLWYNKYGSNLEVMQAMNEELYQQKLMACWHGKNIGGTLGGPYEGFPQINHLTFYDPVPQEAMPNDDLELQAMYVARPS